MARLLGVGLLDRPFLHDLCCVLRLINYLLLLMAIASNDFIFKLHYVGVQEIVLTWC